MDNPTDPSISNVAQAVVVGAFTLAGVAMMLKRMSRLWQGETRETVKINAETDVIKLLRDELHRVIEHNASLTKEVDTLRELVAQLQSSNNRFEATVRALHSEIEKLRGGRNATA